MPTPNPIQHVIDGLRASGLSQDALATATAELDHDLAVAREHACAFCGRSSNTLVLSPPDELAEPFPCHWVYCYRDSKPFGLCDLCFGSGHYWGLSDLELAYFTESFAAPNEPNATE